MPCRRKTGLVRRDGPGARARRSLGRPPGPRTGALRTQWGPSLAFLPWSRSF
jgi:hypothetical protein